MLSKIATLKEKILDILDRDTKFSEKKKNFLSKKRRQKNWFQKTSSPFLYKQKCPICSAIESATCLGSIGVRSREGVRDYALVGLRGLSIRPHHYACPPSHLNTGRRSDPTSTRTSPQGQTLARGQAPRRRRDLVTNLDVLSHSSERGPRRALWEGPWPRIDRGRTNLAPRPPKRPSGRGWRPARPLTHPL